MCAKLKVHGHVSELLHEVRRRLVLNDLHVSDFYATIGNRYGAELHAERALELAQAIAEQELVLRCEELLTLSQNLKYPDFVHDVIDESGYDPVTVSRRPCCPEVQAIIGIGFFSVTFER